MSNNKLFILLVFFTMGVIYPQCQPVTHLLGPQTVNDVVVTVSTDGIVGSTDYCSITGPYWIGSNGGIQGNGAYTFTFSPPITGAQLDFTAVNNYENGREEISLYINGNHYAIPEAGTLGGCSNQLGVLTPEGNIGGAPNSPAVSFGWNGTVLSGMISTLTVRNTVLAGWPNGSIFSLQICTNGSLSTPAHDGSTFYKAVPNPFSTQTNIISSRTLDNATVKMYNSIGVKVLEINNITSNSIRIERNNLSSGLYILKVEENNRGISYEKLIIN